MASSRSFVLRYSGKDFYEIRTKELRLSREEVARKWRLTPATIARWESGRGRVTHIAMVALLSLKPKGTKFRLPLSRRLTARIMKTAQELQAKKRG